MQLSTIEFNGFKRLHKASCNVDGQTVAFIGPNEVGKTSVLRGLAWLTAELDDPRLPLREQNRRNRPNDEALVVRAHYRLDATDIDGLRGLDLDVDRVLDASTVRTFRLSRRTDGEHRTGIEASVERNPQPFRQAKAALEKVDGIFSSAADIFADQEIDPPINDVLAAITALDPQEKMWDQPRVSVIQTALGALHELLADINGTNIRSSKMSTAKKAVEKAISSLQLAAVAGERPEPSDVIRSFLSQRVPKFLLFGDDDRELSESYHLGDDSVRQEPPAPLFNLLAVAGTSVDEVWAVTAGGDAATMRTLERRMNETLRERLRPMWTQSDLTIELTLNQGGLLEVNILELDSPDFTVTPIAERSDGLRTFLGLVCFLIAANLPIPPVLLVDEAERNLHYDAQADLIRVLTRELKVHKVLFTTHSPGCLPLDLGTGIRVVSRNPEDPGTSRLLNNFWTSEEPGFSHLLFAMGAEAAAFSASRRAVLAEGVSEMILLPTLLRNATDGSQLDFQIAFGLSNLAAPRAIGSVALITTFLVDGDSSGRTKKEQLEKAGVPPQHIFQLPKNKAIEDLVDRRTYLATVNEFLAEQGKSISARHLASNLTIAKAVDDYAKSSLGLPDGVSHKIIASRLALLGKDLKLSAAGRTFLAELRPKLEAAFEAPYVLI